MNNIKQIYHNYQLWEDYKNGMYSNADILDKNIKVFDCIELLSNNKLFYNVCNKILKKWPISSDVNLSNVSKNRRAWLGAAACNFHCGAPEYLTRIAWGLLNRDVKDSANNVAEKIIAIYEKKYRGIHSDMGEKMLF